MRRSDLIKLVVGLIVVSSLAYLYVISQKAPGSSQVLFISASESDPSAITAASRKNGGKNGGGVGQTETKASVEDDGHSGHGHGHGHGHEEEEAPRQEAGGGSGKEATSLESSPSNSLEEQLDKIQKEKEKTFREKFQAQLEQDDQTNDPASSSSSPKAEALPNTSSAGGGGGGGGDDDGDDDGSDEQGSTTVPLVVDPASQSKSSDKKVRPLHSQPSFNLPAGSGEKSEATEPGKQQPGDHEHNHTDEEENDDVNDKTPFKIPDAHYGQINNHIFQGICGSKVFRAKVNKLFPRYPSVVRTITSLASSYQDDSYFQRIFGYLIPPETGSYTFYIASDDTSELWLSTDHHPKNERLLCYVGKPEDQEGEIWTHNEQWNKYASQQSQPVQLVKGQPYYVEIFHKQGGGGQHVEVGWRTPVSEQISVVSSSHIALFKKEESQVHTSDDGHDHGAAPPSHTHLGGKSTDLILLPDVDARADYHQVPIVDYSITRKALPMCDYNPSYAYRRHLSRYEGVNRVFFSQVYPPDGTEIYDDKDLKAGNPPLDERESKDLVSRYLAALNAVHKDNPFQLKRIVNVVKKGDHGRDRYLIEVDVTRADSPSTSQRISEYVYTPGGSLCYPRNFEWNKHAMVHIIIPVKNQVHWVEHLIANLEEIWDESHDAHFNLILSDYSSTDGDYEKMLKKSRIPNWQFIKLSGNFERAGGIQAAVDLVRDSNSIIFTCDLHLDIPSTLLDAIRKYTVKGKQGFAPVVVRLGCGFTPAQPNGFWELAGYGLFAMYKTDFDSIGGMNTREFKDKWGGEDWEMLDRVLSAGFEVERLRHSRFYHFWHSKKGMWSGNPI